MLGLGLTNYETYQDPYSVYRTYSNRYAFTTFFGLRLPDASWKLDLGIDFQLQDRSFKSSNKLLRFSKTFHDAIAEITLRDRNDNLSVAFRINILCGKYTKPPTETLPENRYWYPWRGENDLRDF